MYHVKGWLLNPYPNVGGSLSDSEDGSEYVTYDTKNFSYSSSKWTMSKIRTEIMSNTRPIQAGAGYYNSSGQRNGGHMVVINGTYTVGFGDSIHYLDPWDATEHWVTYTAFCDGSYNGRKYDQTVWYN